MNHVLATSGDAAWRHGPTEGMPRFRAALARSLRRRARAHPRPGRRAAGARSAGALPDRSRRRGDRRSARVSRRASRRSATPARGSSAGTSRRADTDELEELLLRYRPKLIYTNPTHHNPTGITLSIRTRRELLELAARYRVPIVEDDTYRELALHRSAAAAVALQARRGAHRRHPHQQLFEDAGAGAAPWLDQRRAADHRSARADQAAGRSAHAEPVAARRLRAGRTGRARRAPGDAQDRASPAARRDGAGAAAARARRAAAVQRARRRHVSVVPAGAGRPRPRRAGPRAARVGDGPDRRAVLRRSGRRSPAADLLHLAAGRQCRPRRADARARARRRRARRDEPAIVRVV